MTDAKIIELLWIFLLLGVVMAVHLWHLQQMKIDHLREHIRLHMTQGGTVRVTQQDLKGVLDMSARHARHNADGTVAHPVKLTLE